MKRIRFGGVLPSLFSAVFLGVACAAVMGLVSCAKPGAKPKSASSPLSEIRVEVRDGGPVIVTTSTAEFQFLPAGYLQATLLKDGKRLTLDDPDVGSAAGSGYIMHGGQDLEFIPDFGHTKVLEASGKLGRGKRIEVSARPLAPSGVGVERTVVAEIYDDFPNMAFAN